MTISMDRPDSSDVQAERAESARQQTRGLKIAIVVLAVVALGLGAVVAYNVVSGDDSAVPDGITQVLDDYATALETGDDDLFRSIVTDDYSHTEDLYRPGELTPVFTSVGTGGVENAAGWRIERFGEPIVAGDGPWIVSVGESLIDPSNQADGTSVYVIVDENGTLKIAKYYWAAVKVDVQQP